MQQNYVGLAAVIHILMSGVMLLLWPLSIIVGVDASMPTAKKHFGRQIAQIVFIQIHPYVNIMQQKVGLVAVHIVKKMASI
jgi:hypothetical protein